MFTQSTLFGIVLVILTISKTAIPQLVSPCPRLFAYEPQKENDRWYGVVTLISDSDLKGVWLRLLFDKPSYQLGNWFGEIRTTDNTEYLIHNRNHEIKANMPYALRFYIKFNPNESPPKLVGIRLNARPVCPEGQTTTPAAITGGSQLITSGIEGGATQPSQLITSTTPATATAAQRPTFTRPGGGWNGAVDSSSDEDDVFQGDFQLLNRPHLRPTAEVECGTVVRAKDRRKRDINRGGVRDDLADYRQQKQYVHSHHNAHFGRTPNFPTFQYIVVDDTQQSTSWSIQQLIEHFLGRAQPTNRPKPPPVVTTTTTTTTTTEAPRMAYDGVPYDVTYNSGNIQTLGTLRERQDLYGEQIAPLEQQPRPLITYGQSTSEGEFPWHAALYHERGADLQYICGASLISRIHVITVAHCVTRRRSATALNPDSLVVYLGKYYLKKWSNPGIQDSQVENIIAHPEYNSQTYANDVAVLKLLNPVKFSDYVRPICLWGDGNELSGVLNKAGTVVGWGFDHTGKVTEALTQAKMPVVSKETCIYSFPDFFSRFTTSKTYCAGFRNGTSVCNGDSGGGMVFPKAGSTPGREVWQLRGLVSISVALQNQFKCDSSHYVVFTDVAKYMDWITNAMRQ